MKNVRIIYTKGGRMRFVSHLDMNRFMTRMIRRAGIPVWYTEGFHPHPYITFALPLSLGFESRYEVMDLRLSDDNYPLEGLCDALNAVFPPYVHAVSAAEPVLKAGRVAFAEFVIDFSDGGALAEPLVDLLKRPSVICRKQTKSGAEKEIDLIPKIRESEITATEDGTRLRVVLPAGSQDNVNPELLIGALFEACPDRRCPCLVTRTVILDGEGQIFR